MQNHLFGMIDTVSFVGPDGDILGKVGEAYMQMTKGSGCEDLQRQLFLDACQDMIDQNGADAVLLGGTGFFLAFVGRAVGLPVVGAARVQATDLITVSGQVAQGRRMESGRGPWCLRHRNCEYSAGRRLS